ncbi:hypothetical protein F5887DRAFT_967344, partial [Amanita rubescens]
AKLPVEIVDQIMQSLAEDADSLAACARAARLLRPLARPLLFRRIRLSFLAAPTRLLNLLTEFPELISFVTNIEIHADATVSDNLQPLLTMFCGSPDNDDRYHGAGPLRSVSLVRMNWNFLPLLKRRVMLALLSCSSVTTITLRSNVAFHFTYFAYFSSSLRTLNLYSCLVSIRHVLPGDTPLKVPARPAQITSLDFMDSSTAPLLARSSPIFNLSYVTAVRVFVRPGCLWSNTLRMFKETVTTPPESSPLHTLSLILAPFGNPYLPRHSYISPSDSGWLGFDLSSSPFYNLRTLEIYAHSEKEALPMRYSLVFWIASTLEKLPQQSYHLEMLLVYIMICEKSQLDNLGLAEHWSKLVEVLRRIELPRASFLVKLEPRSDQARAIYDQFERFARKLFIPALPKTQITINESEIIWPPEDISLNDIWSKSFS